MGRASSKIKMLISQSVLYICFCVYTCYADFVGFVREALKDSERDFKSFIHRAKHLCSSFNFDLQPTKVQVLLEALSCVTIYIK